MKLIRFFTIRVLLVIAAALTLFASASNAQVVRQTNLYIDNGFGAFSVLQSLGAGTISFPAQIGSAALTTSAGITLFTGPAATHTWTYTLPDASATLAYLSGDQTFTGGLTINGGLTLGTPLGLSSGGSAVDNTAITQNYVFAGPGTGSSAGDATFRPLVAADIPPLSGTYLPLAGGTMAGNIAMNSNNITMGGGNISGGGTITATSIVGTGATSLTAGVNGAGGQKGSLVLDDGTNPGHAITIMPGAITSSYQLGIPGLANTTISSSNTTARMVLVESATGVGGQVLFFGPTSNTARTYWLPDQTDSMVTTSVLGNGVPGGTYLTATLTSLGLSGGGHVGRISTSLGQATAYTLPDPGAATATIAINTTAGVNSDITSLTGLTTALPVDEGGTGTTALGSLTSTTTGVTIGGTGNTVGSNITVDIATASGSQDGLLSSTDWNTFNGKANAFTAGDLTTSTTGLTIVGGTGATVDASGATVDIATASGSQAGLLSSVDWTTFNGKANSGTNSDITSLTGLTTALKVSEGGTGATTFTSNAILYGNSTSAIQALTPNATAMNKFLTQSSANSGVPAWNTIQPGDISGVVLLAPTAVQTITPTSDIVPLTIKNFATGTSDELDIQDGSGNSVARFSPGLNGLTLGNSSGGTKQGILRLYNAAGSAVYNIAPTGTVVEVNTSFEADGSIQAGRGSIAGSLKISDGTAGPNYATLNDPDATNSPVFNLPAETGAGPYTLATTGDITGNFVLLTPASAQAIQATTDAIVPLTIEAHSATQSADLQDWSNSTPSVLASIDASGDASFVGLTSSGSSTIATSGSTINTFASGGSSTNSFGSGGSSTNSFGDGGIATNTFGTGGSAINTIGSDGISMTTILGGTSVGINNSSSSAGATDIADGSGSTGSVSIGNTTGGVTITSTNWSASGAALTAGGTATAGSLAITDGAGGKTYTLKATTGGSFSPIFLLPTETGPNPYTLATTGDNTDFVNSINNAASDATLTFAGTGSGPYTGAVTGKLNLDNANTWTNEVTIAPGSSHDVTSLLVEQTATASPLNAIMDVTNTGASTHYLTVDPNGNIGIGMATPSSQFSNFSTGTNIVDPYGTGGVNKTFTWVSNSGGYAATVDNSTAADMEDNGLLVKVANNRNASLALEVSSGDVGAVGTTLFDVWGNGNVTMSPSNADTISIGNNTVNTLTTITGGAAWSISDVGVGTFGQLLAGSGVSGSDQLEVAGQATITTGETAPYALSINNTSSAAGAEDISGNHWSILENGGASFGGGIAAASGGAGPTANTVYFYGGTSNTSGSLQSNATSNGPDIWTLPDSTGTIALLSNVRSAVSGTQNYVSKFGAGGTSVGNSQIFDNGTSVGIGTATPVSERVEIAGSATSGYNSPLKVGNSIGTGATFINYADPGISGNARYDGGAWVYDASGKATNVDLSNGGLTLYTDNGDETAGDDATFIQTFAVDASGDATATKNINTTTGAYQIGGKTVIADNGTRNFFAGVSAGNGTLTGTDNTYLGNGTGTSSTGATANTAVGSQAGLNLIDGQLNTAVGYEALNLSAHGFDNTTIGFRAGQNIGLTAGTQTGNSLVGAQAGDAIQTGNDNTAIGYKADFAGDYSNATAIGYNASAPASNTIQLGNPSVTNVSTSGNYTTGDATTAGALAITDGAGGYTYTLKATTGGSYSPTFLLPVETSVNDPYTLATTADIAAITGNFVALAPSATQTITPSVTDVVPLTIQGFDASVDLQDWNNSSSLTVASIDASGDASFVKLTSRGNSTIATGASTVNSFGNGGSTHNYIGNGGSSVDSIGNGGSAINYIGRGGSAANYIGGGGSESTSIGGNAVSSSTNISGSVGINDSSNSSSDVNIENNGATGAVNIGNVTGGTSITGKNWSVDDATGDMTISATSGNALTISNASGNDLYNSNWNITDAGDATFNNGITVGSGGATNAPNTIQFNNGGQGTLVSADLTAAGAQTWTLPAASGTIALQGHTDAATTDHTASPDFSTATTSLLVSTYVGPPYAVTMTIPAATSGTTLTILWDKGDSSLTITPASGQILKGTSFVAPPNTQGATLVGYGTNWYVVGIY